MQMNLNLQFVRGRHVIDLNDIEGILLFVSFSWKNGTYDVNTLYTVQTDLIKHFQIKNKAQYE